MTVEITCTVPKAKAQLRQLMSEMRAQNYDVIIIATYRTACKLRFIQKQTHLCQIDIWNMIEAFRENSLHTLDPNTEISMARLEAVLHTAFSQLNKRLPQTQLVHVEKCVSLTMNWLMSAYDRESTGHIQAFAVKVALAHLASGKLVDKLRYIFTLISDPSGHMVRARFDEYLRDLLMLPAAVYEGTSFRYSEEASRTFFDANPVTVNDFLSVMMAIPGRQTLMWLPALNRMSHVENVVHPVQCEACRRASIAGFRYKCRRCCNYNLCQDCFWRGKTSGNHSNDHDMKEHTSYRSGSKQLGHSIKKSFDCVPSKSIQNQLPHFPDTPQKTLDLSFIVPPTPVTIHNGYKEHSSTHSLDVSALHNSPQTRSVRKLTTSSSESCRVDDEHRLIARYAARLAADENKASRSTAELSLTVDNNQAQRELIAQLEAKNRDIMREIQRLRLEQEAFAQEGGDTGQYNPTLLAELRLLRQRKDELEARMQTLQESRKDLMVQLETLMKLLKNHPTSPRSTPNSSPRSRSGLSPTFTAAMASRAAASPAPSATAELSLSGLGGDVKQAFTGQPSASAALTRSLRNDLLVAADSVTNAMSSLVKELHSDEDGSEGEDEDRLQSKLNELKFDDEMMSRSGGTDDQDMNSWGRDDLHWRMRQEAEFLAQLRARRQRSSANSSQTTSDNEQDGYPGTDEGESSLARTDDESFVGTDEIASCGGERLDEVQSVSMRTDDEGAELPGPLAKEMTNSRYTTDDESFLQTDDESFIRTDDEEGGNTDWEESTRRWINR
ncbi:dystrobrevin beta isoform X2 [Aplysia californica]|uniref:Dystrobrevin beta isoform X2 n=1 Tax=Aplysia californica TaxID=6500 RepID=A0ABM1A871_APLCA|nr:dystrobrevin beta isoform X2 [Aplysia californica]